MLDTSSTVSSCTTRVRRITVKYITNERGHETDNKGNKTYSTDDIERFLPADWIYAENQHGKGFTIEANAVLSWTPSKFNCA